MALRWGLGGGSRSEAGVVDREVVLYRADTRAPGGQRWQGRFLEELKAFWRNYSGGHGLNVVQNTRSRAYLDRSFDLWSLKYIDYDLLSTHINSFQRGMRNAGSLCQPTRSMVLIKQLP